MLKLETVIAKGGTSPSEFTLHDADHAFRVAKRMEDLLSTPVRKNLSDYELAFLLLSAYGHDVGMTPTRGKVISHHRHLFNPEKSTLTFEESERFRKFLDDQPNGPVTLPLSSGPEDLDLADQLISYYVRDRHNEWSAEWLRENLVGQREGFGILQNSVEILITLCSSHHWDFTDLVTRRFDPFTVDSGPDAQIVHLRFLACILRLADILENDPKRTPEIIFQHRNITDHSGSAVFWWKDHDLSISERGNSLHFQARPRNAQVHRALVQLADWIDYELHGIAAIGHNFPAVYPAGKRLINRSWHLAPALTRDIRPFDNAYEYIDGAFRPNTGRLLQILSGEQLYGKPFHAVRELLQNAFDAVREKIARKRLEPHIAEPADRKWEEIFGNQEKVTLTLRPNICGGWQLTCEDSGVGLTRSLITNHVLVSGTGRRHSILDLERKCRSVGFHPGLTGQFGIGVLSYFMLAEEVTMETTRYQGCEDGVESWLFTTRGVGSFGELRKTDTGFPTGGTRLRLNLRKDRIADPLAFATELLSYLKTTLVRIPCRFSFVVEGIPDQHILWERPTGWTRTMADYLEFGHRQLDVSEEAHVSKSRKKPRVPEKEMAKIDQYKARARDHAAEGKRALRCESLEIEVAGAGPARLVITWFETEKGRVLTSKPELYHLHQNDDYSFSYEVFFSHSAAWKGMSCKISSHPWWRLQRLSHFVCVVELDLIIPDSRLLAVNRDEITFPDALMSEWLDIVEKIGNDWADEVLAGGVNHFYHEINNFHRRMPLTLREGSGWFLAGSKETVFGPLSSVFAVIRRSSSRTCVTASGKKIPIIRMDEGEDFADSVALRIAVYNTENSEYLGPSDSNEGGPKIFAVPCCLGGENSSPPGTALFPHEWNDVVLFDNGGNCSILNSANPIVRLIPESQRDMIRKIKLQMYDFEKYFDGVETAAEFAIGLCQLMLHALQADNAVEDWEYYLPDNPNDLKALWIKLSKATGIPLEQLQLGGTHSNWRRKQLMIRAQSPRGGASMIAGQQIFPPVIDPDFMLFDHRMT